MNAEIPKDLEAALKVVAAQEGRDPDELVEEALKAYLLVQYLKHHSDQRTVPSELPSTHP